MKLSLPPDGLLSLSSLRQINIKKLRVPENLQTQMMVELIPRPLDIQVVYFIVGQIAQVAQPMLFNWKRQLGQSG